jgi:hypothetical protein
LPSVIEIIAEVSLSGKELRNMIWWLWHNVGHREKNRPLTYGQIAALTGEIRGSIQMAIIRFEKRLKREHGGILLGQLLRIAANLWLDQDQVYQALAKKRLVPVLGRKLDGFDIFGKRGPLNTKVST